MTTDGTKLRIVKKKEFDNNLKCQKFVARNQKSG